MGILEALVLLVVLAGAGLVAWRVVGRRSLRLPSGLLDPAPAAPALPPARWCPQCESPLTVVRTEGDAFVYMCDTCVNAWPPDWAALLTEDALRERAAGRAAVEAEKARLRAEQIEAERARRRAALAGRAEIADRAQKTAVGCSAAAVRTRRLDIHHHGRKPDLRFRVNGLAERDFERYRLLAVRYEKDPRTRVQRPAAPDTDLYQDCLIYAATVLEDRGLWDDPARADRLATFPGPLMVEALLDRDERAWVLGVVEELSRLLAPGARA